MEGRTSMDHTSDAALTLCLMKNAAPGTMRTAAAARAVERAGARRRERPLPRSQDAAAGMDAQSQGTWYLS